MTFIDILMVIPYAYLRVARSQTVKRFSVSLDSFLKYFVQYTYIHTSEMGVLLVPVLLSFSGFVVFMALGNKSLHLFSLPFFSPSSGKVCLKGFVF